ncbi:MAG: pyruvate ferredoxin oxidoreductase [Prevotellaceae bacterium]|nr:pyruvate ferredoxin oxidoreductase [Prevotellaceae bacterium]
MDYKYIEQLLQRYWECETSLEEEAILRAFFSQKDIPEELKRYASLFEAERQMAEEAHLPADFDERLRRKLGESEPHVKARSLKWNLTLRPLFQAAALVAIFLTFGLAMRLGWQKPDVEIASVEQQPGDSTSIKMVDETTAEGDLQLDSVPAEAKTE